MDSTINISSQELLDLHRMERLEDDSKWEAMIELHRRGSQAELKLALQLAVSHDAVDREIAADLLAQLGCDQPTFVDESVAALINLLSDSDPDVVAAAAVGLGHRPQKSDALVPLLSHAKSVYDQVRFGVVFGLLGCTDPVAIEALIELSHDEDSDVRNWATFGLGSMIETDSPPIREALVDRLSDEDYEIRGEAMVGLAERGDERVRKPLVCDLASSEVGVLHLEAAEILKDTKLLPLLQEIERSLVDGDDEYFIKRLRDAIKACR